MTFPSYPEYKEAGVEWLGEVPEHWCSAPIKYMALERNSLFLDGDWIESKDISSDGIRYITTGNVGEGAYKEQGAGFISEETFHSLGCTDVYEGDVLISRLNSPIGRACITPDLGGRVVTSVDNVIFRPDAKYHKKFIVYLFSSEEYFKHTGNLARGATMQRISRGLLGNIRVVTPSLEEQTQIARFLDHETARIDALIEEQQRLIELLKEKRQAVISHAVTKGLDPTVPMKDSGVEWLGEVPAHWSVVPFGLGFGYQEGPGIMAVDFRDEGVPLVRISGVQGRWVTLQGCNYLDPAKANGKWGHFRLERGDLIISGSASMGLVSEVGEEAVGAVAYTGLIRLTPKADISDRDFIRSVVGSYQFFAQIDLLKAGSTIQHFGPTHLSQMKVVLPPLDEQIKVAAYVDKVSVQFDQLLDEAAKNNDLLQERRSALISAAVTGKIDVRGWQPPASAPTPELVEEAV